jgi:DNA mismatch repair ATPase MutS
MELLASELLPIKNKFKSDAFIKLADRIFELTESEYYVDLNERLKELTSRVREIKSVTIGVNLDARLRPENAGVLSVNNEKFKSGDLLQKILRLDFKTDEYTCIASLQPFNKNNNENQQNALSYAFNNALNSVFKSSMRSWKKVVQAYVLENADFLIRLLPEIEFLVKTTELICSLKQAGNDLCFPKISTIEHKIFDLKGLYNPVVAFKLGTKMVENDFSFDENGMFYILSGPNRGGKSVISCAVGLTFVLAQLGACVPAKEATISPVDAILIHFPTGSEDTIDKGRLGEECARLDEIFDVVTENSLVILDETLSSTGSFEASYIASEIISGFSMVRCRGIFSTHLHELTSMLDEINERCVSNGGAKIDTLVAGIEEGERSFKITRKKPDGRSYAKDIASKYGISLDNILKKISKK